MRPDQLVLQVCNAHVEAEPLHLGACEVGAESSPLEPAPEVALLSDIAEAGDLDVEPVRAELVQNPADGLRPTDRHDRNALGVEITAMALGERLERALVADPFDEHDCLGLLLRHGPMFTASGRRSLPSSLSNTPVPIHQGATMRRAFMSIQKGFSTYSEGMTLAAER